ncbi:hypothetical protein CRUP_011616 [Coryphaenoides rupestris]|nr:hypothetical protein CRUP_011616 [Coryphaenoides rupestris]
MPGRLEPDGRRLSDNACKVNYGGCGTLCLAIPGGRVCACADNQLLERNNVTCAALWGGELRVSVVVCWSEWKTRIKAPVEEKTVLIRALYVPNMQTTDSVQLLQREVHQVIVALRLSGATSAAGPRVTLSPGAYLPSPCGPVL